MTSPQFRRPLFEQLKKDNHGANQPIRRVKSGTEGRVYVIRQEPPVFPARKAEPRREIRKVI